MLNCPLEKHPPTPPPKKKKKPLLVRLFLLAFPFRADKSLKPVKPGEISTIMGLRSTCNGLITRTGHCPKTGNLNDLVITHYPNHSPLFHSTNLQIEHFYILGYFYFVHLSSKFWLILFYILFLHKNSC